jgi:cell division septation protein DedD
MSRDNLNKPSVIYVNKWLVMLAILITASISFFLGFIVGKNYNKNQIMKISSTNPPEDFRKKALKSPEVINQTNRSEITIDNTKQYDQAQRIDNINRGNTNEENTTNEQTKSHELNKKNEATTKTGSSTKYTIQVGAFKNEVEAIALKTKLKKKGYNASINIVNKDKNGKMYRVIVGEFSERKQADNFCNKLRKNEGLRPFVTIK